jgi:uncharacterized protein (TIGR00297 family)
MLRITRFELTRHLIHAATPLWILALPWCTSAAIIVFLLTATLANLWLPMWMPSVLPKQRPGHGHLETVFYPAALLAGFLGFSSRITTPTLNPVGIAWPILAWLTLAWGDPLLGMAHRLLPMGTALPWNHRKRWLPWCIVTCTLTPFLTWVGSRYLGLSVTSVTLAVILALLAETLWFGIDDNWLIPFAMAWVGGISLGITLEQLPNAYCLAAPFLFGVVAFYARKLTAGGAVLGAACGFVLILAHPGLFVMLCVFFAIGVAATSFGHAKKQSHSIAEARGGRRGAAQVFGAMGIATWVAPMVLLARHSGATETEVLRACLVPAAPWVAKAMDTASSEVGKAFRGRTWLLPEFKSVAPGTEGAWSLAGTVAGLVAALVMVALGWALGFATPAQTLGLVAIALGANFVESLWARFWDARGVDPGAHTNVILTLVAALLAWLWF